MSSPPTVSRKITAIPAEISNNDYISIEINGQSLRNGVYCGVYFRDSVFHAVDMAHAEFSECAFFDCTFSDVNLKSADLVYSSFQNCRFVNCIMDNGEWRESTFSDCRFNRSTFGHTTISLCEFVGVEFDEEVAKRLPGSSVRYNIFAQCLVCGDGGIQTPLTTDDVNFRSTNFGIDGYGIYSGSDYLTRLALDYPHYDDISAKDLIVRAADQLSGLRERTIQVRVRYFNKICSEFARNGYFSPILTLSIESALSAIAPRWADESSVHDFISAVLVLRRVVIDAIESADEYATKYGGYKTSGISLYFPRNISMASLSAFKKAISILTGDNDNNLQIKAVHVRSIQADLWWQVPIHAGAAVWGCRMLVRNLRDTLKESRLLAGDVASSYAKGFAIKEPMESSSRSASRAIGQYPDDVEKLKRALDVVGGDADQFLCDTEAAINTFHDGE